MEPHMVRAPLHHATTGMIIHLWYPKTKLFLLTVNKGKDDMKMNEMAWLKVESVRGMKLGKRENPEKTLKIPTMPTKTDLPGDTEPPTRIPSGDRGTLYPLVSRED